MKMKKFEDDKELRKLLKEVSLESPEEGFSSGVMSRIFEEKPVLYTEKQDPVLGLSFWIIIGLFAAIILGVVVFSGTVSAVSDQATSILQGAHTRNLIEGYRAFFDKLGGLPQSVAVIFMATSLLVLLEKLIGTNKHSFSWKENPNLL